MRCKNCGWENPDNLTKCEKCQSDLGGNPIADKMTTPVSDMMKGTVSERIVFDNPPSTDNSSKTCPRCGYLLSANSTSCPNCNYEFQSAPVKNICKLCGAENVVGAKFCSACGSPLTDEVKHIKRPMKSGTVMAGPISEFSTGKIFCTLKPIAWEGEERRYEPITYSGEEIVLTRSNTDANNNSITSHEQAILAHKDGEWYIENRSELRTTFIRVNGRIKLNSGDIIVLGNREFEFKG